MDHRSSSCSFSEASQVTSSTSIARRPSAINVAAGPTSTKIVPFRAAVCSACRNRTGRRIWSHQYFAFGAVVISVPVRVEIQRNCGAAKSTESAIAANRGNIGSISGEWNARDALKRIAAISSARRRSMNAESASSAPDATMRSGALSTPSATSSGHI